MFFRRAKKDPESATEAAATCVVAVEMASSPIVEVEPEADGAPDDVADDTVAETRPVHQYSTTDDLEAYDGWLGQDHVMAALDAALSNETPGSSLCIVAQLGSGARRSVAGRLQAFQPDHEGPGDWVYVHNFDDTRRPVAVQLKAGTGMMLAQGVFEALSELCVTLKTAFDSDDYKTRRRAIMQSHENGAETLISALRQKAAAQNIALLRTPEGYALAPMHDGKVVKPAVFGQLPQVMRDDIAARIAVLQTELVGIVAEAPQSARRQYQDLDQLRRVVAERCVAAAFAGLDRDFSDEPAISHFFASAKASLVQNSDVFEQGDWRGPITLTQDQRFQRYLVNVFTTHRETARTVTRLAAISSAIALASPARDGGHMDLMPAPLHFANGGILLLTAEELEQEPGRALCQAIARGEIDVPHPGLSPMPLPFDAIVVILCDEQSLKRLQIGNNDVSSLVKTAVRWTDTIERTAANEQSFACWIAALVQRDQGLPLTAAAVNALIEDSARRAESSRRGLRTLHRRSEGRLSLSEDVICDVIADAHRGALLAEDKVIDAGHVRHALAQRTAATVIEQPVPAAVA